MGVDHTADIRREFDADVRAFVDQFVAADGAVATEKRLQDRYGTNPESYGRQQEALAYLRVAYREALMTTSTTDDSTTHTPPAGSRGETDD